MDERVWDKDSIQKLIDENDKAVCRAIVLVYRNQTHHERDAKRTEEHNGVGFSGYDGEILSSFAEFYLRAGFLTPKQIGIARPKMKRYWKQILADMESRGLKVSYKVSRPKKDKV